MFLRQDYGPLALAGREELYADHYSDRMQQDLANTANHQRCTENASLTTKQQYFYRLQTGTGTITSGQIGGKLSITLLPAVVAAMRIFTVVATNNGSSPVLEYSYRSAPRSYLCEFTPPVGHNLCSCK